MVSWLPGHLSTPPRVLLSWCRSSAQSHSSTVLLSSCVPSGSIAGQLLRSSLPRQKHGSSFLVFFYNMKRGLFLSFLQNVTVTCTYLPSLCPASLSHLTFVLTALILVLLASIAPKGCPLNHKNLVKKKESTSPKHRKSTQLYIPTKTR